MRKKHGGAAKQATSHHVSYDYPLKQVGNFHLILGFIDAVRAVSFGQLAKPAFMYARYFLGRLARCELCPGGFELLHEAVGFKV